MKLEIIATVGIGLCFLFGLIGLLSNSIVNEALGGLCILAMICLAAYTSGTR